MMRKQGKITLFNPNVVTTPEVTGQTLLCEADGGGYIGGFIANPVETQTTEIAIDIVLPRGLYYANNNGGLDRRSVSWRVEVRRVNDEGESIDDTWSLLGQETITDNTNTPKRQTYHYRVSPGRYEVRLLRTDRKELSARAGHEICWAGLKATLNNEINVSNVTLLALKMRATDNLSQNLTQRVNCIVTRKLRTWDVTQGWQALQPTRSIAWALADIATSEYGGKLADNRIDLNELVVLDKVWEERGDTFDAVFDQAITVWEALTRAARCGRAVCFLQGGILRCVRDTLKHVPVGLFSPRNIVKHSFSLHYLLPSDEAADSVKVQYFSAKTWQPSEVCVSLSNSISEQSAEVSLFGCTDKQQAVREGKYICAANHYRRRLITFQTELEGLIPTYGDLIAIVHDMPRWGQSADVVEVRGNTLILSEALVWEDQSKVANNSDDNVVGSNNDSIQSKAYVIGLRRADGSLSGPWAVEKGDESNEVVLQEEIDVTPYTGEAQERTQIAFGVGEQYRVLARVMGIRPRGDVIEISAVTEDEAVHRADTEIQISK